MKKGFVLLNCSKVKTMVVLCFLLLDSTKALADMSKKIIVSKSAENCTLILKIISYYEYDGIRLNKSVFYAIKPVLSEDVAEKKWLLAKLKLDRSRFSQDIFALSNEVSPKKRTINGTNFILRSLFGVPEKPVFSKRLNGQKAIEVPILDSGVFLIKRRTEQDEVFTFHVYFDRKLSTFGGIQLPLENSEFNIVFSEITFPLVKDSKSFLRVENIEDWFLPRELKRSSLEIFTDQNSGFDIENHSFEMQAKNDNDQKLRVSYNEIEEFAQKELGARIIHGRYMSDRLEIELPYKLKTVSINGFSLPGTPTCFWQAQY